MTNWLGILYNSFWLGCAACGFGLLFQVAKKNLAVVWIGGAVAGLVKYTILNMSDTSPLIASSFCSAMVVGLICLLFGIWRKEPAMIFAIPSVIPLIPGVYAYHTMLGLIKLAGKLSDNYSSIVSQTIHDGATTLFITISIAIGVGIPLRVSIRIQRLG